MIRNFDFQTAPASVLNDVAYIIRNEARKITFDLLGIQFECCLACEASNSQYFPIQERDLFERKKTLPSDISLDHKHFLLLDRDDPPDTIGLIPLLKNNLENFELVYQRICSAGYDANVPVSFMSDAEYSIELVAKKG